MRDYDTGNGHITGLIVGTILGAALGAGVALLYAPRSGRETRKLLARKSERVKEKVMVALEQGKDAMRREVENVAKAVEVPAFSREPALPRARS